MRRILITGGSGFIGSHLCRRFLDDGDEVICMDNLLTGRLQNIEDLFGRDFFTFLKQDVSEFIPVPGSLDAILHFASPASPSDFERFPIQILKVGASGPTRRWVWPGRRVRPSCLHPPRSVTAIPR